MNEPEVVQEGASPEAPEQKLTGDGIKEWFDTMTDACAPVGTADFSWSAKGLGFGGFYFYRDGRESGGRVHCANEIMSKEFIKRMLCQMVDDCVLDEPRSSEKKTT